MTNTSYPKRTDTASRVIKASPHTIYAAMIDPQAMAAWRPPQGMRCRIYSFEAVEGGSYRMAFEYQSTDHEVSGKTSAHADVFTGKFLQLVPDRRIVEEVQFESDDAAFAEPMTITTLLEPVEGGTKVSFVCENVSHAIRPEDHEKGMNSTLDNLAKFVTAAR